MIKIFSKTAFTLIELLVAITLVTIVLLGVFAINSVLNTNSLDYSNRYSVRSALQATLNHILNNASLAVGSANANDSGILIGAITGDANTFCIHQAANANQVSSTSDIWLCYSWSANTITWCAETYSTGAVDPRGATSCSSPSVSLVPTTSVHFLGTSFNSFSSTPPGPPTFTPSGASQLLFTITLQGCLNNALGTCSNTGTSTDLTNNPEFQVTGSVIPTGESM